MPLVFTPGSLLVLMLVFGHISAKTTLANPLVAVLLGPATIAFAVPVYDNTDIIKRHWMSLSAVITATWCGL